MNKFTAGVAMLLSAVSVPAGAGEAYDIKALSGASAKYARFEAVLDLTTLPPNDVQALAKLMEAGRYIDHIYWLQNSQNGLGLYEELRKEKGVPVNLLRLVRINYGVWDRIEDNAPLIAGAGPKPPGSGFYPPDMGRTEFDAFLAANKGSISAMQSPFTVVKRSPQSWLYSVPYYREYLADVFEISRILNEAAALVSNESFRRYLMLRASAIMNDEYFESDKSWMDISGSPIDAVIGPYETYDDALLGFKAAYEGVIMKIDGPATEQLKMFQGNAAGLEANLPVPAQFRKASPGASTPISVCDVVQYSGQANAGIKAIAASLPNDEKVREQKGAKTIIFRNVMEAKYEMILRKIAEILIDRSQLDLVKFDAFFQHSLLHELSHPLGLNYVFREGRQTTQPVRTALSDRYSTIEECKADVIGLYSIGYFIDRGMVSRAKEAEAYATQLASIFRTVRFGAAEDHGKANMIQFNYLKEKGAIKYSDNTGAYSIDVPKMREALRELGALLLTIEATGDYAAAGKLIESRASIPADLKWSLSRLKDLPVDVEFAVKPKFSRGAGLPARGSK